MNEQFSIEALVREVQHYAEDRRSDVARGAETPRLAALILQKYGLGMAKAAAVIFDSPRAADSIMTVLDEETAKIDPNWRDNARLRWAARPADLLVAKI